MTQKILLVQETRCSVWLVGAGNESRWLWNQQFWSLKISYFIVYMIWSEWLFSIVQPINFWREETRFLCCRLEKNLYLYFAMSSVGYCFGGDFHAEVKINDSVQANKLTWTALEWFHFTMSGVWLGFLVWLFKYLLSLQYVSQNRRRCYCMWVVWQCQSGIIVSSQASYSCSLLVNIVKTVE